MKFSLLVIVAVAALSAAEKPEDVLQAYVTPASICGRQLAAAVAQVCRAYSLVYPSKRSIPNSIIDHQLAAKQLPRMKSHRGELIELTRGKRQGIVNECCFQSCTVETLLSYC